VKFVILLGRGIEGCGVTKFTTEMVNWAKHSGHTAMVYASKHKKYSRGRSHNIAEFKEIRFNDKNDCQEIIQQCATADYVIINSFPAIKFDQSEIAGFESVIHTINTPLVIIQHDHNLISIKRNAAMLSAINKSKVILTHSINNPFVEYVRSIILLPNIKSFQPGFDFETVKNKYWKPISQTVATDHRWVGRATVWKGYYLLLKFHDTFLKSMGAITMAEGIESSLHYSDLCDFKKEGKIDFVDCVKMKYNDVEFTQNAPVYFLPVYNHNDMMCRMSTSGFGYQLSHLKSKFIEKSIEYTHCEVVASGALPVFRKAFGELCTHRQSGVPLINTAHNGTVWLDDDNLAEAATIIARLMQDSVMRDEYRSAAYECYKAHQDSAWVFADILNKIKE
jgi:hypothetical protein